jgi:hypothetical protein
MPGCFVIMRRRCRRRRVADENMVNSNNGNGSRGYSGGFSYLWSLFKAFLITNDTQPSTNTGEEDDGGGIRREIYGDNTRNIWFANDPAIAEKNYLAVQSSMRYAIYM